MHAWFSFRAQGFLSGWLVVTQYFSHNGSFNWYRLCNTSAPATHQRIFRIPPEALGFSVENKQTGNFGLLIYFILVSFFQTFHLAAPRSLEAITLMSAILQQRKQKYSKRHPNGWCLQTTRSGSCSLPAVKLSVRACVGENCPCLPVYVYGQG